MGEGVQRFHPLALTDQVQPGDGRVRKRRLGFERGGYEASEGHGQFSLARVVKGI